MIWYDLVGSTYDVIKLTKSIVVIVVVLYTNVPEDTAVTFKLPSSFLFLFCTVQIGKK